MKSILITGASGFLGSHILSRLNPEDYRSIALVSRRSPILPSNLARADNVKIITASVDDTNMYKDFLDKDTYIIHLAAVTGKAKKDDYFKINTEATRQLIAVAEEANVCGFLFISSIAVSFSNRKAYYYAESKEIAEIELKKSSLKYCIIRPTIILGKESPIWKSFSKLANSAFILLPGDGAVTIQPIFVDDLADLILSIIADARFNNETLEIGGPNKLTIDEFVRKIHLKYKGSQPRIIHLPLGPIVTILRIVEKVFPDVLPVNSGQFSSFTNDGAARENTVLSQDNMKNIDEMLDFLVGNVVNESR